MEHTGREMLIKRVSATFALNSENEPAPKILDEGVSDVEIRFLSRCEYLLEMEDRLTPSFARYRVNRHPSTSSATFLATVIKRSSELKPILPLNIGGSRNSPKWALITPRAMRFPVLRQDGDDFQSFVGASGNTWK